MVGDIEHLPLHSNKSDSKEEVAGTKRKVIYEKNGAELKTIFVSFCMFQFVIIIIFLQSFQTDI